MVSLLHTNPYQADVKVIYYDPIHDFGFLKFDPKAVKRMTVPELALRPDLLTVGMEIRVIGNDSSTKLNIAAGTISRLNRNAPIYSTPYSDFNTNYIQGSAMTSGGSSGSPVIGINGHTVALNCGTIGGSMALFLPLDQPLKTLGHLQRDEKIPRGTIQTGWTLRAFHECHTLGLTDDWISTIQALHPEETSMLVAETVLAGGPGESKIEEGDILLKVDGKLVTQFKDLTDTLDANVLRPLEMVVQRGDKEVAVELDVEDLHAITPDRYVMVAGSVFHNLSYMMAHWCRFKLRDAGVFMCIASGAFDFGADQYLIHSIDGKKTPNLDAFIEVICSIPGKFFIFSAPIWLTFALDGAQVRVTCTSVQDIHKVQHKVVGFDRRLCNSEIATRNFETGLWSITELPECLGSLVQPPPLKKEIFGADHPKYINASYILNSLVCVSSYISLPLDGFSSGRYNNYGLIINASLGLILIPRTAVLHYFCRCTVMILNSITVRCDPIYLHPTMNIAILRYDPACIETMIPSASLSLSNAKLGDSQLFFQCNTSGCLELTPVTVTGVSKIWLAAKVNAGIRATNMDILKINKSIKSFTSGCGLINEHGRIQALWLGSYFIHASVVIPIIRQIEDGMMPKVRSLGAYLLPAEMKDGKAMGVTEGNWCTLP